MTPKPRYMIRVADGELFGFCNEYLKLPGLVEYDPAVHGYRAEVAAQLGLTAPAPSSAPKAAVPEQVAGPAVPTPPAVVEPAKAKAKAQTQPPEPNLSDVFDKK